MHSYFLGLPVLNTWPNLWSFARHYLSIILFTGLWYFITNIGYGAYTSAIPFKFQYFFAMFSESQWTQAGHAFWADANRYIQEVDKHYELQAYFLLASLILGHLSRVFANVVLGDRFYHLPKTDKFFYPIAIVLAYLVINELFGF